MGDLGKKTLASFTSLKTNIWTGQNQKPRVMSPGLKSIFLTNLYPRTWGPHLESGA